jgi:hypothetical protein
MYQALIQKPSATPLIIKQNTFINNFSFPNIATIPLALKITTPIISGAQALENCAVLNTHSTIDAINKKTNDNTDTIATFFISSLLFTFLYYTSFNRYCQIAF